MKIIISSKGFTLMQFLVGAALLATLGALVSRVMNSIMKGNRVRQTELDYEQRMKLTSSGLKIHFGGAKSFENIGFQVTSGGAVISTVGPGFIVDPNKDFRTTPAVGVASPGNDLIYFLEQVPFSVPVKLNQDWATGAFDAAACAPDCRISVSTKDGTTAVNTLFFPGDLVVFSSLDSTEIFKLAQVAGDGSTADLVFGAGWATNTFTATGNVEGNIRSYKTGDYIFKAKMGKIGYDASVRQIKFMDMNTGMESKIMDDIDSFSISYNLRTRASENACVEIVTAVDEYKRDRWADLNAGFNNSCYQRFVKLKFQFVLKKMMDLGPSNSREYSKSGEFIFVTNNN